MYVCISPQFHFLHRNQHAVIVDILALNRCPEMFAAAYHLQFAHEMLACIERICSLLNLFVSNRVLLFAYIGPNC